MIERMRNTLMESPKKWLVTGVAGFIGSNLLEELLKLGQTVTGIDNYSTGHRHNLENVKYEVGEDRWSNFAFIEGDVRTLADCTKACAGIDYILHQAALGSVPRSIENPIHTNQTNIDGFLNMLVAARDSGVKRFVYAASSSTYGDHPGLPKREDVIGKPLSPYAVTKYVNEIYADVFSKLYGIECIGLRYFNVFGRRQDPNGAYAAVIPRWIGELLNHVAPTINGNGETSRDFCYIDNVVQANIISARTEKPDAVNQVYNVAYGGRTTLSELFHLIKDSLIKRDHSASEICPVYGPSRAGDVEHSQADIEKAGKLLGYKPEFDVRRGMEETVRWYWERQRSTS